MSVGSQARRWRGEIVGHRGAAGLAAENTLVAFEAGIRAGCQRLELDVRATRDGLVVFHDATLDRFLPDGSPWRGHAVGTLPTSVLAGLDVGSPLGWPPAKVPTFDEILDTFSGRVLLNVECKGSGDAGARTLDLCVAALHRHGPPEGLVLSSFHESVLARALTSAPDVARAFIADEREAAGMLEAAARARCAALHPKHDLVDVRLVEACRQKGLDIRAWTVNDPDPMRRLIELDVAGIVTDRPDLLRALAAGMP